MSLPILLSVLAAAFLHALWNALSRLGGSKIRAMVMLSLMEALVGAAIAAARPMPIPAAWPWIAGAGFVHFAYKFFLAQAYEQGDLSRVYPIARGAAPKWKRSAANTARPESRTSAAMSRGGVSQRTAFRGRISGLPGSPVALP